VTALAVFHPTCAVCFKLCRLKCVLLLSTYSANMTWLDNTYTTSLSVGNIEADDHNLVEFESERTTQCYAGRVLEVTEKKIRSIFMRKKCCDKFGNVQFYSPENPNICLHPLEDVVFKLPIPLCGQTKQSAKLLTFAALSCLPTTCSIACRSTQKN